MTTTPETRDLIARVRAGFAPADQPQALYDLARTADGEPRVDAEMLRREAEIIEIRRCIERADRHGLTSRFGDDRTLLAALDQERAENDKLRARVAELEAEADGFVNAVRDAATAARRVGRREGAEAMREQIAKRLDKRARQNAEAADRQQARADAFDSAADDVREMVLDDDAREDAQVQGVNER